MMPQSTFQITEVDATNDSGTIVFEPLEAGYGHTLGNSLRRVMLSSLSGYAITEVKINGVQHQFSTLKGMSEDVVELILNIKQVRISSDLGHEGKCSLSVKGKNKSEVTAGDIQCEAGFTIVNPDLHIATLDEKASLDIEMSIGYGIGYSVASERKPSVKDAIPVDALCSPVVRVSYDVESTRVGRRTDFDKLVMKVWTDGTISARSAVEKAAEILLAQFDQIIHPVIVEDKKSDQELSPEKAETLRLTVEELDLPTRIANALRKGGYETVGDLIVVEKGIVAKVKNLGDKSVNIVQKALLQKGVDFIG